MILLRISYLSRWIQLTWVRQKKKELIATILEQLQSLIHEFRNFRSNTDQNINNIKEFTETSDRNRANKLNYAVQNENRTPIERLVAMDIEECEALKTYLLNLRHEIGQIVVASDPKNLNIVQQLAADKEQWLRESNRVAHLQNQSKNQSNNTPLVPKRNATDLQPWGFSQPLDKRKILKCSKCSRIGYTAEMCYSRNFPLGNQERIPPRVYQTAENPEETFQESTVLPPENYYQYYCSEKTEEEPDFSLILEQE